MPVRILGISGSARKGSYNTALLRAAQKAMPDGAEMEIYDISGLPMYNQDLEGELPEAVVEFKGKVKEADAIVFTTPEHNYSVSALLKNAIEWGNRPEVDNSWDGKPAAVLTASTSLRGGARAQLHLRHIMVDLNMHPINLPQLMLGKAPEKFDETMGLTDPSATETVSKMMIALVDWTKKLNGSE